MMRLGLRGVLSRKFRLVSTVLAIVLGVGFMAGSFVFTDTLNSALAGVTVDSEKGTDAYVRGPVTLEGGSGAQHAPVSAALADRLAAVEGVESVAVRVQGYAQLVGPDGKPLMDLESGAPPFGFAWAPSKELNAFRLVEGAGPTGPGQIVIDLASSRTADLPVGSATTVITQAGPQKVRVVGVARFGSADSYAGTSSVLFDPATAQAQLGVPGKVDAVAVSAEAGVSQAELARRLKSVLGSQEQVLTGEALAKENAERSNSDMAFFTIFMGVFAAVAMIVGAFFIKNTFAILVTQRTKELALLRALGASRKQVRRSVAVEALIIGAVASILGLFAGVGVAKALYAMFDAFGLSLPEGPLAIEPRSMLIAFAIGLVITTVSAFAPARRASKVAPIAALRDVAIDHGATSGRRTILGVVLTGASAAATVFGISAGMLPLVGAGALGTFLGVSVLGPVIARPAARLIGAPLPRFFGVPGRLARENAARNPRRTAATAAALMVGVGLVGSITTFAASGKHSVVASFDQEVRSDYVVRSGGWSFGGFSRKLADDLASRPEVAAVTGQRMATAQVGGKVTELSAWQAATIAQVMDLGTVRGSIQKLGENGLAVSAKRAEEEGWKLGDQVPIAFAKTGKHNFVVAAITEHSDWTGELWVSHAAFDAYAPEMLDTTLWVVGNEDTVQRDLRTAVAGAIQAYPNAELVDREGMRKTVVEEFNAFLGLVYAMLGMAVVIALLGIANTIALSVTERTRELGLLRAVGTSRPQLRGMVRWEAAIIAVFGTLTGLSVGLFLGWAMVFAVRESGVETARLVVPFGQLGIIVAIAALCGVVAALLPARRAARLDVLRAITAQ